jgi:hypothetical protein
MPKFMLIFHGGGRPDTPEEGEKTMAAWGAWMQGIGSNLVDGGAPAGMSKTVTATGVEDNGGANPVSGYTLINAADIDAACAIAQGCPILEGAKGTVEVAEALEM